MNPSLSPPNVDSVALPSVVASSSSSSSSLSSSSSPLGVGLSSSSLFGRLNGKLNQFTQEVAQIKLDTSNIPSTAEIMKSISALSPSDANTDSSSPAQGSTSEPSASPLPTQVSEMLSKVNNQLQSKLSTLENELRQKAAALDQQFDKECRDLKNRFEIEKKSLEEKYHQQSEKIVHALKSEYDAKIQSMKDTALAEFEKVFIKSLDEKCLPAIYSGALDPLMPVVIQELILNIIESAWPHIKEELMHIWQELVLSYEPIPEGDYPSWCPNFLRAIKASFLYHTFPYDRSIWWQTRKLDWWVWNLIAVCPFYGIQAAYFIFLFLCIDKSDEYSVVNFILQFKGFQFVTLGLLSCLIGSAQYVHCILGSSISTTSMVDRTTGSTYYFHQCNESGPGSVPGFYTDMCMFVLQAFTIWLAMFVFLPTTVKKGLRRLSPNSAQSPITIQSSAAASTTLNLNGGKLWWAILFDTIMLIIAFGITILLIFVRPYRVTTAGAFAQYEWMFKADIFWIKTLYGLASFPFVFFLIPILRNLLLHTRPTGYNRSGECVPKELKPNAGVPSVLTKRRLMKEANTTSTQVALTPVRIVVLPNTNKVAPAPEV